MKGFQANNETKIAIAVKRLTPSAKRGDIHAFADGVRFCQKRYGHDVADEAMRLILVEFPNLTDSCIDIMPEDVKAEFTNQSVEMMADIIEQAGLKIEDHLRVSDGGIALTTQAVKAIAATGYPRINDFGKGNEEISGMGINRSNGFLHPLSNFAKAGEILPEETMNSWAVVSVTISAAQGWIEADKDKSFSFLSELVSRVAPTLDLTTMLRRSRYDDRALLKLCNLAHSGFENKIDKIFNK